MKYVLLLMLFAASFYGGSMSVAAMGDGQMHNNHQMNSPQNGGMQPNEGMQANAANQAYMKAMDGMHDDMMTGIMDPDPDTAFVRGMIPHHQGAIDMAKIQLKYGKDPKLRKLAQDIIDAQEKEIAFMNDWLKKNGKAQ